jgi:hypothetical protein
MGEPRWRNFKKIRLAYINSVKKDKPCADCNVVFPPCCMDFDHLEGFVKLGSINKMLTANMDVLRAEIAKCELVCSNCHRIRTIKRRRGVEINVPFEYSNPEYL